MALDSFYSKHKPRRRPLKRLPPRRPSRRKRPQRRRKLLRRRRRYVKYIVIIVRLRWEFLLGETFPYATYIFMSHPNLYSQADAKKAEEKASKAAAKDKVR